MSVAEAAKVFGVRRTHAYKLIARYNIPYKATWLSSGRCRMRLDRDVVMEFAGRHRTTGRPRNVRS